MTGIIGIWIDISKHDYYKDCQNKKNREQN